MFAMAKSSQPISEFMTKVVAICEMEMPLSKAKKMLQELGVRHLPVVDHEKLVGVVSHREVAVLEAYQAIIPQQLTVADAMVDEPYTVNPNVAVSEVCATMAANKYGSVVVAEGQDILGIFTTTDALQILAEIFFAEGG